MPHESATCHDKVWTCCIKRLINKEIFLFPTKVGENFLRIRIEVLSHGCSSLINCMKSLLERHFVVECFTRIGNKDGRNHQCVANDKDRRGGIPCGIATSLEGGSDTAR